MSSKFIIRMKRETEWPNGDTTPLATPYSSRPWEIFEQTDTGTEYYGFARSCEAAVSVVKDILKRRLPEKDTPSTVGLDPEWLIPEQSLQLPPSSIDPLTMRLFLNESIESTVTDIVDTLTSESPDQGLTELKSWLSARFVEAAKQIEYPGLEQTVLAAVEWLFDHELIDLDQLVVHHLTHHQEATC